MPTVTRKLQQPALILRSSVLKIVASLGGRTIAMLTVALLVTLASILFNDNWILSLQQQDAAISRTREITIELHKLCTELYHAESSQRGFLLMRQPQFLESYSAAATETRKSINMSRTIIITSIWNNNIITCCTN